MSKSSSKPKASSLSETEIQSQLNRYQSDLQAIASKVGELETEADEHDLVLESLEEALGDDPNRKCFRLIGGVLVERTVKDVVPAVKIIRDGLRQTVTNLAGQYKVKEEEMVKFTREHGVQIRPAGAKQLS